MPTKGYLLNRESKEERLRAAILHPEFAIRELCNRSFRYFVEYFWDQVSNDDFSSNWHIDIYCDELEILAYQVGSRSPKVHDLVVNVPPGTSKTRVFSVLFNAWCWTKWHWMQFIAASYSKELALEAAELTRDLIRSQKFQTIYPELTIKPDKDVKSNFRIVKKTISNKIELGGNRFSTSVGGTLMGFHGHFLLIDDPLNPKQAASEAELKTCLEWCTKTLPTRKCDKRITPTVYVMQRLAQNDPSGAFLASKKNIRHICLPGELGAYIDKVSPPELISKYVDGLLDPVRMPRSVLDEMMADLGQYGYAGQVGQSPTPPGGGMFKVDQFQIVDGLSEYIREDRVRGCVRYWDKAGTKDGGAATCGVKMYKIHTISGEKYLITDVKKGHWNSGDREKMIRSTAEADGTGVLIFHEQEPGSGGKDSAHSTTTNLAGFVADGDRPTGNKVVRADPYSVQVNWGNVLLARGEWNREFIEEHRYFPFSKLKDQVDASSGAFTKLARGRVAGTW